jgi:sugar/nucleoside kinase (ribokinase family)
MPSVSILCLGDALVDLVREREEAFVPHPGGAIANVCVVAARLGARVALAGGAGDDDWGRWLRERLSAEGVGLEHFALVEGASTAVAFVTVDGAGDPSYLLYGGGAAVVPAPEAVEDVDAVVVSSNTLIDDDERAATLAVRERALDLDRPVVFDPNLRLHRWPHPGRAASVARECVPGAFLVKCNRAEAQALTGEDDPERAAAGLLAAGARHAVITLGAAGAILRGEVRADAPGRPVKVVNAAGAGDALLGVLLARLSESRFYPPTLAAALGEAVRAAERATERWSAV